MQSLIATASFQPNRMFILQLYSGQNTSTGDFIYRIARPAEGLSSIDGITVKNLDLLNAGNKQLLLNVPLLILHHMSDPDLLPVIKERRNQGFRTIYELADNFRFSQSHKTQNGSASDYPVIMEEIIRRCDAVQTTSFALRNRYQDLNDEFFIFPNLVDKVEYREPRGSDKLTIGWGGSARHLGDLKQITQLLIEWVSQHPGVRLAIMGSKSIRQIFEELSPEKLLLRDPGSLKDYLAFLDEIDIGIAPLLSTEFNACRSDVKFLEYASHEVVPVCSRVGPYIEIAEEGESLLLFNSPAELIQHLERLRTDVELRSKIARNALQWVGKHRLSNQKLWESRAEIYREFLPKYVNDFEWNDNLGQSNLADLIMPAIKAKNPAALLMNAVDLHPDDYQAYYFYGWGLSKQGRYKHAVTPLRKALSLRPDSIRTAELLVRVLLINGDLDSALRTVEHGLTIEPNLKSLLELKLTIQHITDAIAQGDGIGVSALS